jgi:hypothetical protein
MRSTRRNRRGEAGNVKAPRHPWRGAAGVLAVLLAVAVHAPSLDNPFVYDDHDTVVANPSLVDLSNVRFILTHSPFRPVVNVSYALDRWAWGLNPFGYHVTNLALHGSVVALLYLFLLRALSDARSVVASPDSSPTPVAETWAAFTAASVFAVHPLMTEAAGYVSGRSELLCGAFFLAAMLCGRAAMLPSGTPGRRRIAAVLAGSFALLALLSKEVAVALPIVLLAYAWLVLPVTAETRRRLLSRVFAPLLIAMGLVAVYRLSVMTGAGAGSAATPLLTLLTQAIVIWRYIGLLALPVGQSIMHAVHTVTTLVDPLAIAAVSALVAVAWIGFKVRSAHPLAALGILWFLATLAPSSSFVALREGMAEHRVYLASAGILVGASGLLARGLESARLRRGRVPPAYALAVGSIMGVLSLATVARYQVWASPVSLWREATRHAPDKWEPHYALADALREGGDCAAGVPEYERVIQLRPRHRDAHTNLGICLAQTGRMDEAAAAFTRALEIDPGFARGYTNLGALALISGTPERAVEFYLKAIEAEPGNVLARMQLAKLYEGTFQDYHAAARMCGEARALAPSTPGVAECVERNQRLAAGRDAGR